MSDTARNAADTARGAVNKATEKGEQLYHQAADTARSAADSAAETGERVYRQATDQAQRQTARLADVIREEPVISALVAVVVGYLLGSLLTGRR